MTPAGAAVARWLGRWRPEVALVLGSGLGDLGDQLDGGRRLSYTGIPGFAVPGVAGHRGQLIAGTLSGKNVLVQSGRFHGYEGHGPEVVAVPVRLFRELGISTLVLTNAAGGIAAALGPGSLMLIADHLNFMFTNPLIGAVVPGELRFPDMSEPYDAGLRSVARRVARASGIRLDEGVYAGVSGPSYETRAEIAMLRRLGADAVGMSTVPEVIAARAAGLRCLAISTITNRAAGLGAGKLSHDEVVTEAKAAGERLGRLIRGLLAES